MRNGFLQRLIELTNFLLIFHVLKRFLSAFVLLTNLFKEFNVLNGLLEGFIEFKIILLNFNVHRNFLLAFAMLTNLFKIFNMLNGLLQGIIELKLSAHLQYAQRFLISLCLAYKSL